MEENPIIAELKALAELQFEPGQRAFYRQMVTDAKPVECVPMREVFTPEQMGIINANCRSEKNKCYKNASDLVRLIALSFGGMFFPEPIWYVEGFAYVCGLPIEHAFVKYGDVYIDPTFERALHMGVRKEMYVSCIELEPVTMSRYQIATGYYGDLYLYDYTLKNNPARAAMMRKMGRI